MEADTLTQLLQDLAIGHHFPKYLASDIERINKLANIYSNWCKLANRMVITQGFAAFVLGQPSSYWESNALPASSS